MGNEPCLYRAIEENNVARVKYIIENYDIKGNYLIFAISHANTDIISLILNETDVLTQIDDAIHIAAILERTDIVKLLLSTMKRLKLSISSRTLHSVCRLTDIDILTLLTYFDA